MTLIAQAGDTLNGMTLGILIPYPVIRDDGFVAFRGLGVQQGMGIYLGNGTQTLVVVQIGASPFQIADTPALNNAGQIAFYNGSKLKPGSCPRAQ